VAHGRQGLPGLDPGEGERLAQSPGGVDKDDEIVAGAGQGVLDVELVVGVTGDAPEPALLQPLRGGGPQAVVPAAGIADPQDERSRRFRSTRDQRTFL
jgi:hypothetical protein